MMLDKYYNHQILHVSELMNISGTKSTQPVEFEKIVFEWRWTIGSLSHSEGDDAIMQN